MLLIMPEIYVHLGLSFTEFYAKVAKRSNDR